MSSAVAAAACGSNGALPTLTLEPALGGRMFDQPIEAGVYEGDRLFVAERAGRVWVVSESDGRGSLLLDISEISDVVSGEGLLSFALDSSFEESGHIWVYYFAAPPRPSFTHLSRFTVEDGGVDLASELVVLALEQPGFNQNGGAIRFGRDGLLYLSLGDGSASSDPFLNGQDKSTLLGSVIRIDVGNASEADRYRIPDDNPFVSNPNARPEIFAYGFRNPFRMSIDPESGGVWVGDVQFMNEEEIDLVEAGKNYGWNIVEGTQCLRLDCDQSGLAAPSWTYAHESGRCAVIGGVVYRGDKIRALRGRYLFGDLCSGEVWAMKRDGGTEPEVVVHLEGMLVSFGTDAEGEVLVLDHAGGGVYRLVEADE